LARRQYPGIREKDNGYQIRITYTDPKTGRRKEKKKFLTGVSKKEALMRYTEMVRQIREGGDTREQPRTNLGTYAAQWSEARAYKWKPSTRDHYAVTLEQHILPYLGNIYLDQLERSDIMAWLSARANSGRAAPTVNGWLRVLKTLLRDAIADGYLDRDPTVRIAMIPEPPTQHETLSFDELGSFLKASEHLVPDHHALFVLGFLTGGRWGELTALTWEDINEDDRVVHFRRSHYYGIVGTTKTGQTRSVPVSEVVVETLRAHRRRMFKRRHRGISTGLVFPANVDPKRSKTKGYRTSSSVRKAFDLVCTDAGIRKHLSSHSMRRTFNNLLRLEGTDRVALRAMTGHSSEEMTEHYSDVRLDEKRSAISSITSRLDLEGPREEPDVDLDVDLGPASGPARVVRWNPDTKKPRP
jgi:integrase